MGIHPHAAYGVGDALLVQRFQQTTATQCKTHSITWLLLKMTGPQKAPQYYTI